MLCIWVQDRCLFKTKHQNKAKFHATKVAQGSNVVVVFKKEMQHKRKT